MPFAPPITITEREHQNIKSGDHTQRVIEAHKAYLEVAQGYLDKARQTLARTAGGGIESVAAKIEIETFIKHAERQIDQTRRRVILGEVIPHAEKVFSVFETHTEWISKGKAGVPVELGLRVCVMEDQHRFVLHHRVMEKQTDDQVTVAMVKECFSVNLGKVAAPVIFASIVGYFVRRLSLRARPVLT